MDGELARHVVMMLICGFGCGSLHAEQPSAIEYEMKSAGQVSAAVYDAQGRMLRPLLNGQKQPAGKHSLQWDGLDRDGNAVAPGDYTVRVLSTPGFTAKYITSLGINPGIPLNDPAYQRSGRQWAGSHGGVSALAIDGDSLYIAGETPEFVPILLKQSLDGKQRSWERDQFQPAQGAVAMAVARGRLIFLQHNGKAMITDPATGSLIETWDLKHKDVTRDESQLFGTGGKIYNEHTIDLAGRGDVIVVSHKLQNVIRWIDGKGNTTSEAKVTAPRGVAITPSGDVLVISEAQVLEVESDGTRRTLVTGLTEPLRLTVDTKTNDLLVLEGAPSERIKRFSSDGKLIRTYGREGGRKDGIYDGTDFRGVTSMVADGSGGFFVSEPFGAPRRVAHLDSEGKIVNEWFGPTGFFTVPAIDPQDPTRVWYNPQSGYTVLASIDYAAGTWKVLETYKLAGMADGLIAEEIGGNNTPPAVRYHGGKRYLVFQSSPPNVVIHENGQLIPVVAGAHAGSTLQRAIQLAGPGAATEIAAGFLWHDRNQDGAVQGVEIAFFNDRMPSTGKVQAPSGEGFSLFGFGQGESDSGSCVDIKRLTPKQWHGSVPEYPTTWETIGGIPTPRRTGYEATGVLENKGDIYATMNSARDRHGSNFPSANIGKVRVAKLGPDGKLSWVVGRHAIQNPENTVNPSPPGEFHESTGLVGHIRDAVVVCDRSVRPATAWTDDGLYAGDFLDHRAADGLSEVFYHWWRSAPGKDDSILNFDHEIPGKVVEYNGEVYWFANGWQCIPVYRITGWDGWERQELKVRLPARGIVAKREGTGLKGSYFSNLELTGKPSLERIERQVWFSRGDWYQMQADVWTDGPTGLGQKTNFSARWVGEVESPLTEDFSFSVYASGRVRLWLDGQLVIGSWYNQIRNSWASEPIRLQAGKRYAIRLDLSTTAENPEVSLNWESFSIDRERIPKEFLYPVGDGGKIQLNQARLATKPIDPINFSYSKGATDLEGGILRLLRSENGPISVGYERLDFGTGVTRLKAQCFTWVGVPGGKKVEVRLDAPDGPLLGVLVVPSADTPTDTVLELNHNVAGVHDLYLTNIWEPNGGNTQWAAFSGFRFE
ncbi:MAG: PA14 domain-containing protein [Planctomycetales bacterium]|nr:PA14 domain-containing protein [Planctomycetales bacterium]